MFYLVIIEKEQIRILWLVFELYISGNPFLICYQIVDHFKEKDCVYCLHYMEWSLAHCSDTVITSGRDQNSLITKADRMHYSHCSYFHSYYPVEFLRNKHSEENNFDCVMVFKLYGTYYCPMRYIHIHFHFLENFLFTVTFCNNLYFLSSFTS